MADALPTTARDISAGVRTGATSAVEVCRHYFDRVRRFDPDLGAFRAVDEAAALAQAQRIDETRPDLPLAGVPIALKDNMNTRGLATTAGSRMLEGWRPPFDATAVARLRESGAVVIGKTNCDEFAMGSSTENSAFGPTRNPWDRTRVPGGSSGGSAVAVAARLAPVALGSDTGGSIRQPAAMCGIVGFKPTYGRVSRYGLIAFASSLDQIGPLTTTVHDAALVLTTIAGPDPADATAAPEPVPDFTAALTGEVRDLRIGVPRRMLESGVAPEVTAGFEHALSVLREQGAMLTDIELPHAQYSIPTYYLICMAEASSNLARYDGVRYGFRATGATDLRQMYERTRDEGFGPEVKRRILLGTYVLSAGYYDAYYLKAQQVRTLIRRDYEDALDGVDLVALPTTPTPAFELGERMQDPLQMYLNDVFTVSANLTGFPAVSVPCGLSGGGLPVACQLVGKRFDEATVLRAADAFERHTDWHRRVPPGIED